MSGCDWIVCERASRWASALRVALERQHETELRAARVFEVRNHRDLESRLAARSHSLVTIEVDQETLAPVLSWLAAASQRFPWARFVAALGRSLGGNRERDGSEDAREVERALVEAGATMVARSPVDCRALVELAHRHIAANVAEAAGGDDELSPAERVWVSLPWQDE